VEERAGLPAVSPVKAGGEEVPFSIEVHGEKPTSKKSWLIVPMNHKAVLLPPLHTLVEGRAGLPAVSPVKAGGEEVSSSMEVHGKEAAHLQMPRLMSQPCPRCKANSRS
jgi:hypothetical protein